MNYDKVDEIKKIKKIIKLKGKVLSDLLQTLHLV